MKIVDLKLVPQHLPQLAQWHQDQWAHLNPGENLHARIVRMQAYLNADFIPSMYVALDEDLLGSAAIVAQDMESRPELGPWLASVYVVPAFRRQGVATALINHVARQAQDHGVKQLFLFTPDQTVFYQKRGWVVKEVTAYRNSPVTIMTLDL